MDGEHIDASSESFLKEVNAVAQAEKKASKLVEDAHINASKIIDKANSESVSIRAHASKQAVNEKNKIISKAREATDKRVKQILDEAQVNAQKLSSKRLAPQVAREIADSILEE
ncbi:MAG: hypothetical protein WC492_01830 [Candidatus Micrarchaeia archaeon]|jgi:vacuolar-type H+-ATPase subunit H